MKNVAVKVTSQSELDRAVKAFEKLGFKPNHDWTKIYSFEDNYLFYDTNSKTLNKSSKQGVLNFVDYIVSIEYIENNYGFPRMMEVAVDKDYRDGQNMIVICEAPGCGNKTPMGVDGLLYPYAREIEPKPIQSEPKYEMPELVKIGEHLKELCNEVELIITKHKTNGK